jgi:uncharacterized protein
MPLAPPGVVTALHRYPVKSMAGEQLEELTVSARGVVGDRLWAARDPDGKLGSGKSTRRFRRMSGLLDLAASCPGDPDVPEVTFPDGTVVRADDERIHDLLSAHVGRPVTLGREERASHFDEGPLHLVGLGSLARLAAAHGGRIDPRHTRANVVVATDATEEEWTGRRLAVGTCVVQVLYAMPRCVMLELPQAGLPGNRGLLRTVTREAAGELGVVADVVRPGVVRTGDPVRVL